MVAPGAASRGRRAADGPARHRRRRGTRGRNPRDRRRLCRAPPADDIGGPLEMRATTRPPRVSTRSSAHIDSSKERGLRACAAHGSGQAAGRTTGRPRRSVRTIPPPRRGSYPSRWRVGAHHCRSNPPSFARRIIWRCTCSVNREMCSPDFVSAARRLSGAARARLSPLAHHAGRLAAAVQVARPRRATGSRCVAEQPSRPCAPGNADSAFPRPGAVAIPTQHDAALKHR